MGIFDRFKKRGPLILNESDYQNWATQFIEYNEIPRTISRVLKDVENAREEILRAADAFENETFLENVPERAKNITEQHARYISEKARVLTDEIVITTDPLKVQDQLDISIERIQNFRDDTTKNESALREFLETELKTLAITIQELEDLLIRTGSSLDEQGYSTILQIAELSKKFSDERNKKRKYERTLNKYLEERNENEEKKEKHERRINEQQKMVRDATAVEALSKIKEIEEANLNLRDRYERLVFDTRHYLLKHALTMNSETKELFARLKKDPENVIAQEHETLKKEFKELHESIKGLDKEDKKDVKGRLDAAAQSVTQDAKKIKSDAPVLHELKKQVMHDIAALNIYEQEQFLFRNKQAAAEIREKIDFIGEELESIEEEDYHAELERLAKNLSAIIRHDQREDHTRIEDA